MAMKPTTFRFDERFLATLDGLARSMSSSRAAVIRQAVGRYEMAYSLKYKGAQLFIERLRERYGDDEVITLVPQGKGTVQDRMEVLVAGQPTDEATGFDIEILKGRDQEGFWVSEEAAVYLSDSKADDDFAPLNLIVGRIPIGPEGERRQGLSIRISELKPEDVDFHNRLQHFDDDSVVEDEQAAQLERLRGMF